MEIFLAGYISEQHNNQLAFYHRSPKGLVMQLVVETVLHIILALRSVYTYFDCTLTVCTSLRLWYNRRYSRPTILGTLEQKTCFKPPSVTNSYLHQIFVDFRFSSLAYFFCNAVILRIPHILGWLIIKYTNYASKILVFKSIYYEAKHLRCDGSLRIIFKITNLMLSVPVEEF